VFLDADLLRVDQIGSLLRPGSLKAVYARHLAGEVTREELHRAQDDAIRDVLSTQEAHGLPIVTDGEFRRFHFMESFSDVAGMERWRTGMAERIRSLEWPAEPVAAPRKGIDPTLHTRHAVTQRLQLTRNAPLDEYRFARDISSTPVKITLIGTDRIYQGFDAEASHPIYAESDAFIADLVAVQRQMIGDLIEAGCPYVQIDAPSYTRYADADSIAVMLSRGEDPAATLARAIEADNAVIRGFSGATFGIHLCRGNRQSMWHREGTYDSIAEALFNGLNHKRLLLEYDTPRAGTFAPLRYVPKDKIVVLGLITTKTGEVESADSLIRRIEEATRYIPIEQLALSPQCGFSSDLRGNAIPQDAQWRKLDVMMETAQRVWR
jgi:5-methyltetrahydropteroyltriglutamate--homocysteine methyltransferase